jgi:hypothetical protein
MRERLFCYLRDAGRPVSATQVLREVLNIVSPNTPAAHKLLQTIVAGDRRFRSMHGLWQVHAAGPAPQLDLHRTAVLFLQQARGSRHPLWLRGAVRLPETGFEFGGDGPLLPADLVQVARMLQSRILVVWDAATFRLWQSALQHGGVAPCESEPVPISRVLSRLEPHLPRLPSADDAAALLGLSPPDPERPAAVAAFAAEVFSILLGRVPAECRADAGSLARWAGETDTHVDFGRFAFGPEMLSALPESAGVYVMRDVGGDAVYVGKSANLKRRVRSYFGAGALRSAKNRTLHGQLHTLEVIETESEVEALILEMRLIRELQPRINVQSDIHESGGGYGRQRNLLLLVPHLDGSRAGVYFLKSGLFVHQLKVRLGRAPTKTLRGKIRLVYYGSGKKVRRRAAGQSSDREIIFRWLAKNRRNLNFIDVDDAGDYDATIRRIADYLLDPEKLKKKVIYR